MAAEKPVRLSIYVDPEFNVKYRQLAKKTGLTLSQFGYLCLTIGMPQLLRTIDPLASFSDDDWRKIAAIFAEQGVEFSIPGQDAT